MPQAFLVIVIVAGGVYGGIKVAHGVKKAGVAIVHVVKKL